MNIIDVLSTHKFNVVFAIMWSVILIKDIMVYYKNPNLLVFGLIPVWIIMLLSFGLVVFYWVSLYKMTTGTKQWRYHEY